MFVSEYRSAFDLFDKDGSGAISKEELGTVMRNLGMTPTDDELREQIRMHDADGRPAWPDGIIYSIIFSRNLVPHSNNITNGNIIMKNGRNTRMQFFK